MMGVMNIRRHLHVINNETSAPPLPSHHPAAGLAGWGDRHQQDGTRMAERLIEQATHGRTPENGRTVLEAIAERILFELED